MVSETNQTPRLSFIFMGLNVYFVFSFQDQKIIAFVGFLGPNVNCECSGLDIFSTFFQEDCNLDGTSKD